MGSLLQLLPMAKVFVDEREERDYAPVVPADQLYLHKPTETQVECHIEMMKDERFGEAFFQCDDDVKHVVSKVGRRVRKITDPDSIYQLIQNTAQVTKDLGLKMFSFDPRPGPMNFQGHNPWCLFHEAAGAWGCIGERESILPDRRLICEADADRSLTCLLEHRVILNDERFCFVFPQIGKTAGGCQTVRTEDTVTRDVKYLKRKWKAHMQLNYTDKNNIPALDDLKVNDISSQTIKVERRNPLVDMR